MVSEHVRLGENRKNGLKKREKKVRMEGTQEVVELKGALQSMGQNIDRLTTKIL